MDVNELIKVEDDSPERCQGVSPAGQCKNKRVENSTYCPVHLGSSHGSINREAVRNYRLTLYRDRVHEKADSGAITSLREEVGILRVLLEEIWNACTTPFDLALQSNKITDITLKIQKLVKDCHGLEKSIGQYLDKTTLLKIAGDMINIITTHVKDPAIAEQIANEMVEKIIKAQPLNTNDEDE